MKRFELTLVIRDETRDFLPRSIDKIDDDDFVSLLSQFLIVIAQVHRRMKEEQDLLRLSQDDDIPF